MAEVVELQYRLGSKRLRTLVDIRDEAERVYRAMAKGKIPASEGTKLMYALSHVLNMTELASYQKTVEIAEELQNQRRG